VIHQQIPREIVNEDAVIKNDIRYEQHYANSLLQFALVDHMYKLDNLAALRDKKYKCDHIIHRTAYTQVCTSERYLCNFPFKCETYADHLAYRVIVVFQKLMRKMQAAFSISTNAACDHLRLCIIDKHFKIFKLLS
jgi:hypothetical protein